MMSQTNNIHEFIAYILGMYIVALGAAIFLNIKQYRKKKRVLEKKLGKLTLKTIVFGVITPLALFIIAFKLGSIDSYLSADSVFYPFFIYTWLIAMELTAYILTIAVLILYSVCVHVNSWANRIPKLVVFSTIPGFANTFFIILITQSINNLDAVSANINFIVLLVGTLLVFGFSNKMVQTRLIRFVGDLIFDINKSLTNKIFNSSYYNFEKIDKGRVLTIMNEDINRFSSGLADLIPLTLNMVITVAVLLYLISISWVSSVVLLSAVALILLIYFVINKKAVMLLEEARDTRNVFMDLIHGLLNGYKELKIHNQNKKGYKNDLLEINEEYRKTSVDGSIQYINAEIISNMSFYGALVSVIIFVPYMVTIDKTEFIKYLVGVLYLYGPINALLNSFPAVARFNIAWRRISKFIFDLDELKATPALPDNNKNNSENKTITSIESISTDKVIFEYEVENKDEKFSIGPIDFAAKKGEVVFITGGNGSGKTTFAKILSGLYLPNSGCVKINGIETEAENIGEYFSIVHSNFHLFQKIYFKDPQKALDIDLYIKKLKLEEKISFSNNEFSTIDLSGGQRKRIALLRCMLENKPVLLFDEWAADQDPHFRYFFYNTILPELRNEGKIIIAITHDDKYFHLADKIVKFDMGQMEYVDESFSESDKFLKIE